MRYFFDTEFLEDGKTIDLLSIGIVAEDGRALYLQNRQVELSKANPWVNAHVLPHLIAPECQYQPTPTNLALSPWVHYTEIPWLILGFVTTSHEDPPEWWGYYSAYDWVALCQVYGCMIDLPDGWPRYAYDLRQALTTVGLASIMQPDDMPHHALSDARWIAETWRQYIKGEND